MECSIDLAQSALHLGHRTVSRMVSIGLGLSCVVGKACAYFGLTKRSEPIRPILTFDPFDMIGMDFIGPLDLTSWGNKYILHIVNYFTRYSWAYGSPQ